MAQRLDHSMKVIVAMNELPASDWVEMVAQQHQQPLVRYAHRLTGDYQTALDIVQDAFLKLCREDRAKIEPVAARWLYRVCRNRALDIQKKERRMNPLDADQMNSTPTSHRDPAAEMELVDEAARALRLLNNLPENQQEVIRLKLDHQLSYRDIAEVTNLSISHVGYLLHMGLKTIRAQMAAQ